MAKKTCSTCRHYHTEGFDEMKGWCHWFDAYPGMQPEHAVSDAAYNCIE